MYMKKQGTHRRSHPRSYDTMTKGLLERTTPFLRTLDVSPWPAWITDPADVLVHCNTVAFEYRKENDTGPIPSDQWWDMLIFPPDKTMFLKEHRRLKAKKKPFSISVRLKNPRGRSGFRQSELHAEPLPAKAGAKDEGPFYWIYKCVFPVTPEVFASHSLRESRARYHALFESNMVGIATSDMDERILEANDAFLDIIGYTREEFNQGKVTWSAISPKKYQKLDQQKVRALMRHGTVVPFEKEYTHKKGHQVPVLVGSARIRTNPPRNVSFALDISDMKRLEQKKDEFMGTVSHELKTPLAVLKLQIDELRDELRRDPDVKAVRRVIDDMDAQIDGLTVLIQDLQQLARMQANPSFVRAGVFDLAPCVARAVEEARAVHKRTIVYKKERGEFLVRGSEPRILQVLNNLIGNAAYYSPHDSKIVVKLSREGTKLRLCVQDFGIGIPEKELPRIFDRYYRSRKAQQQVDTGSGMGLHISREIMQAHKGALTVESKEGKGSTFCCVLPLAEESTRKARRTKAAQKAVR